MFTNWQRYDIHFKIRLGEIVIGSGKGRVKGGAKGFSSQLWFFSKREVKLKF